MDIRPEFLGLVLACALVTAVPRVLPLLVLSRLRLPAWLLDWLRYVPVAVLSPFFPWSCSVRERQDCLQSSSRLRSPRRRAACSERCSPEWRPTGC